MSYYSDSQSAIRKLDPHRIYRESHPLLLWISISFALGGLGSLLFPEILHNSSIGKTLPDAMETVWAMFYCLGGILTFIGVWTLRPKIEVVGLCLSASACAVFSACIFNVRGVQSGLLAASFFGGVCIGMWIRAYYVAQGKREPWLRRL